MKSTKLATLLAALAFSPAFSAETDPVGFVSVTVPANSDAVLAVPLNRAAEFKGVIQSISGNTITVAGTPAWAADAFAPGVTAGKTYAVQIAAGAKEGLIGKITTNTNNSITVTLEAGDDLTGIGTVAVPVDPDGAGPLTAQADQIDIAPYWTPSSLLGNSLPAGTQFLGYEGVTAGVNKSSTEQYAATGSGWENEATSDDASNTPLSFGRGFVIRNNQASPLTLSFVGSVPMSAARFRITAKAIGVDQDIRFGFMSPIPEAINALGIPAQTGDTILVFNNAAAGINKSSFKSYTFDSGTWYDDSTETAIDSTVKLEPGFGYIYRKFRQTNPALQSFVWQKVPSYLN